MNLIKNTILISVSFFLSYGLLIVGDWFIQQQIEKNLKKHAQFSEASEIIKQRMITEDLPQYEQAILDGFSLVIYPSLIDDLFLDLEFPLIAGLPLTDTYSCNEGYGLVKYRSDRFGFRNDDRHWDTNPQHIMIGDSFVHGACVSNENTLPRQLSVSLGEHVLNLGMGGNSPTHYYTYASLFIPRFKPAVVYLNFYPNDFGLLGKSAIERKYVDKKIEVFSSTEVAFANANMFLEGAKKINRVRQDLRQQKRTSISVFSWVQKAYFAFLRYATLPTMRSLVTEVTDGFKDTERVISSTMKLCKSYDCKLIVSFIPNSEYFRPHSRADRYGNQIADLTQKLGITYIDGRAFIDRGKGSLDFAIKGPHLSPLGYKKMANEIAVKSQSK